MEKELKIPLSSPDITGKEIDAVVRVLQTPHLSLGPKLREFEEAFAGYLGVEHAVAVSSGTAALHLAVKSLGIGEKDAVITTPFSFISSANCILFERALPIFVDIEPVTYNIAPERVEEFLGTECATEWGTGRVLHRKSGRQVKAILAVHVFGHPCDMERLAAIAAKYRLHIIEDACEAIGAECQGKKAGSVGEIGIFAFYPNKQMTTGEGGMLVTRDPGVALLCRSLRNQGRDAGGGWLAHRWLGYNYRLSDLNCALGIAQLSRIEEILRKRDMVARLYNSLLDGLVAVPATVPGAVRSWFVYVVALKGSPEPDREWVLKELTRRGIGCSNYFPPIHLQPFYQQSFGYRPGDFPITEGIARRTVALPLHNRLTADEVRRVVETLREVLAKSPARPEERKAVPGDWGLRRAPLQRTGGA
ncbi:DegT/DnrJ/EryC1/StrS family aminotransferase [Geomonas sp. RF6]|uniref:DegT/DnrJ/EryC1/StrS family aminotransferase n=1 Tax=Geomonas sp. RF6 TaxID=2897342 RepID=UPI001E301D06|nr:DegT/DnrJ/EryC1/StrS family aminotransferase [Geomonas sp. RF6]UFS69340.1 DegT/DnrJ/EryC1/StrS family aminotransferase [Geomonas sp. RF6]